MNRRIAQYDPKFTSLNEICTYGSYILAISTLPFIINAVWSWWYGQKAGDNPWRGLTLEWMTTSPPAIENFEKFPVLATGPYDYGVGKKEVDIQQVLGLEPDEPYPTIESGV
jgi:cytochrome c oxidase subunit 1